MTRQLPRALEFELVGDHWLHVKVDGHVFIYRVDPHGTGVLRQRVKRAGRRAVRGSEHYEDAALEFALKEARARGLLRGRG